MPSALRRSGRKSRNVYTAPKEARFAGLRKFFSDMPLPGSRRGGNAGGSAGGGMSEKNFLRPAKRASFGAV